MAVGDLVNQANPEGFVNFSGAVIFGATAVAIGGAEAGAFFGSLEAGTTAAGAEATGVAPDVTFTHFTSAQGVEGITGLDSGTLTSGQSTTVSQLQFGTGSNTYLAGNPGDIFVTDLPPTASSLQLSQIGVQEANQSFAISFSGEGAAAQGTLVQSGGLPGIYTIPGGTVLTGWFTVFCR